MGGKCIRKQTSGHTRVDNALVELAIKYHGFVTLATNSIQETDRGTNGGSVLRKAIYELHAKLGLALYLAVVAVYLCERALRHRHTISACGHGASTLFIWTVWWRPSAETSGVVFLMAVGTHAIGGRQVRNTKMYNSVSGSVQALTEIMTIRDQAERS